MCGKCVCVVRWCVANVFVWLDSVQKMCLCGQVVCASALVWLSVPQQVGLYLTWICQCPVALLQFFVPHYCSSHRHCTMHTVQIVPVCVLNIATLFPVVSSRRHCVFPVYCLLTTLPFTSSCIPLESSHLYSNTSTIAGIR